MSFFDATIPADSEAVKTGASRIRDMKTALNTIIAKIFDDSGNFLPTWVTGSMIAPATVDTPNLNNGAVTTPILEDGVLSADSTGQAKMADGFFTADTAGRNKIVNGFVSLAKLAWASFFTDAPAKTTPVGADLILIGDSGSSNAPAYITLSQVRQATTFVSAEQSVVTGTVVTAAHGLSSLPSFVRWVLVCKTAEFGYSVGDEVAVSSAIRNDSSDATIATEGSDATNAFLVIFNHSWGVFKKSDPTSVGGITTGNWRLKCYATV